ncbi:MAG: hypothetical protein K6B28_12080 [Lachnospiraceae bacterium]|nr:hypothetical protein [Lachnospiraceae bacterium]
MNELIDELKDMIKSAFPYLILLVISFLFLLLFSLWTSPFYENWYGCDASFFTMVGRGITMGKLPYRDFFDLKGPYFFFIEALGQFIHKDRLGVFIIQVIFMWVDLILVVKICRIFLNRAKTAAVLVIFLFTHASILWGGNTLEEYMQPLNFLVVYVTLKFLHERKLSEDDIPFHVPFISGIASGVMIFSKITVAAPIAGICIGVGISLLIYKRYKTLLYYVIYFILGLLTAIVPILAFFYFNGFLSYMLYCVFEFAFLRGTDFAEPFNIKWELKLAGCFLGFLTGIFHLPGIERLPKKIYNSRLLLMARSGLTSVKNVISVRIRTLPGAGSDEADKDLIVPDKNETVGEEADILSGSDISKQKIKDPKKPSLPIELCLILIFSSLIAYTLLHLGDPFIYYFMTAEPVMLMALVLILYLYDPLILFSGKREAICLIIMGIYIFYFGMFSMDTIQTPIYDRGNEYYGNYYNDAQDLALLIPEYERDSVYSFDIDMTFFEATRIMPCYKYQINLQFFIALNPDILTEIQEYLNDTPPKWLIISDTLDQYIPEIYDTVMVKYHLISQNSAGCLYRLDEEPYYQ